MVGTVGQFTISAGATGAALDKTIDRLNQLHFAEALWNRDTAMWTDAPDTRQQIAQRLGWLDAIPFVRQQLDRVQSFADSVPAAGFTDVVLLGMGGSSLAPEVLRQILGVASGRPRFRMLDSIDPEAVRDAMSHAATSLFVFASKSGGTIEPNTVAAEARRLVESAGHADWGSRFIAITDDGTALHRLAERERFRAIFVNPSNIGGRYSALSLFGMVPAALMGIDVAALLDQASALSDQCRLADPRANPGLALGALMAAAALTGRDKLTLVLPPPLASFGLWIEQLVAESTGKHGVGIVPITGEAADTPMASDRFGVVVHAAERTESPLRERLHATGAPIADITMGSPLSLGAEFLRWEVATAAAGRLMDINPFDEPNVQQAKDATRALLDRYTADGHLPSVTADLTEAGIVLTLSRAARAALGTTPASRILELARPNDYIGILVYLPPDAVATEHPIRDFRSRVSKTTGCATMTGYGPRYLHSTGQLHKGGANNGVFLVITAPPGEELAIPGSAYSFGVLERAQALGDFQSLDQTGRRALLVQLPSREQAILERTFELLCR